MRQTQKRKAVLTALKNLHRPVDVQELKFELKKLRTKIDQATVYRAVEALVKDGLIEQVDWRDGKYRYELQENHHHHLVCDNCGRVDEINLDERKLLKNVSKKSQFLIQNHNLEFFGLCRNCQ